MIDTGQLKKQILTSSFESLPNYLYEPLGNHVIFERGITFPASEKKAIREIGTIPCIRTANIQENLDISDLIYVSERFVKNNKKLIRSDDIFISMANSRELVGKSCMVSENTEQMTFGGFVTVARSIDVHQRYLYFYLKYLFISSKMLSIASQTTNIANISSKSLQSLSIPLPPLEEQKRIVAKIEELFAKIDEIDKAQKELKELAELAEKKVLDMAVRGELVEQDETDQSAEQFISNVKDKIDVAVSKKVIRKKAVTPMLDADIPYDTPGNWCWEKIGALFAINPKNVGISDNDIVGFVPMTLMDAGISNHHEYEEKPWKEIKKGFTALQNGDLAIAKITPCFQNRKSGVIQNLPNGVGGGTTEFHVLRDISHTFDMRYALALVQTQEFIDYGVSHFSGAVGQQRVSKEALADYPFPVPPFEEQQRIGEKIEEYLSLIKTMI